MPLRASLYFHSPCFDGIASGVLALDFLEETENWNIKHLVVVNYEMRDSWLATRLPTHSAVVDFLYHPKAQFWADHHQTTFLTTRAESSFQRRNDPWLIYDEKAPSCASLLRTTLNDNFGHREPRYAELVKWADKIDAARYDSVEEAVLGEAPALAIRLSLGLPNIDDSYAVALVRALRVKSLEEVAALDWVKKRVEQARRLSKAGLQRLKKGSKLRSNDIVVFDVDTSDVLINRYAPYYYYPDARYSVGIMRSPNVVKITAMRNPWRNFPSLPLGKIFERLGGGGHQRVGSLILSGARLSDARTILKKLVTQLGDGGAIAAGSPSS